MIQVAGFIINEKLIKAAMPWGAISKEGEMFSAYPPIQTKIFFIDGSEMIFNGLHCSNLFDEINKLNQKVSENTK